MTRTMQRRRAMALISALTALAGLGTQPARAQAFPHKPIRIIVPSAAGGGNDFIVRTLAPRLEESLKQTIVVENRPGASNIIGTDFVAKSAPDGHTLLFNGPLILQAASLYASVPYDPLRDFTPLTDVIRTPLWFAVSTARVKAGTLKDFVAEARAQREPYTYGSGGKGSSHHLYGFGLAEAVGIDMLHIPYKGGAPAMTALVSGEIAAGFFDFVSLRPFVENGKARALAVTGTKRHPLTPDVPTLAELGHTGFESYGWGALFVPSRTPADVVQRLEAEILKALTHPDVLAKFKAAGFEMGGTPQAEFAAQFRSDATRWSQLIRKSATRLD